jgi:DNA-binding MltR family transcriptional regulator
MWLVTGEEEFLALNELTNASDRAVGIVIASIVEIRLTRFIKDCFVPDPTVEDQLFHSSGPLGSFAAKIRLAYLMGLVSKECHADLETLKNIRNEFAHQLDKGSFQTPSIRDKCKNLKLIDKYAINEGEGILGDQTASFGLVVPELKRKLGDPKERYVITAQIFGIAFTQGKPSKQPHSAHI